jgi:hypothetical protein
VAGIKVLVSVLAAAVVGAVVLFGALALGASPDLMALIFVLLVVAGGCVAGAFGERLLGPGPPA